MFLATNYRKIDFGIFWAISRRGAIMAPPRFTKNFWQKWYHDWLDQNFFPKMCLKVAEVNFRKSQTLSGQSFFRKFEHRHFSKWGGGHSATFRHIFGKKFRSGPSWRHFCKKFSVKRDPKLDPSPLYLFHDLACSWSVQGTGVACGNIWGTNRRFCAIFCFSLKLVNIKKRM